MKCFGDLHIQEQIQGRTERTPALQLLGAIFVAKSPMVAELLCLACGWQLSSRHWGSCAEEHLGLFPHWRGPLSSEEALLLSRVLTVDKMHQEFLDDAKCGSARLSCLPSPSLHPELHKYVDVTQFFFYPSQTSLLSWTHTSSCVRNCHVDI